VSRWNAPFILGARAVVTPLAAGCSVVLKASELSPKSHALLVQTLIDAGVQKEAINVVQADRANAAAVTEALIAHKAIRHVEFIGSATIGRIIGSLAGKYLKPVFCELGGKCAVIVLEDANLDDAAMKCVMGGELKHIILPTRFNSELTSVFNYSIQPSRSNLLLYRQSLCR
jgi:acyl-CoA reductase-like NAD-dependent aldehyde dehydrogenase